LNVLDGVTLSRSQIRVPDRTGILKDRPDYSSAEVQQVPDWSAGSFQLLQEVYFKNKETGIIQTSVVLDTVEATFTVVSKLHVIFLPCFVVSFTFTVLRGLA